MIAALAFYLFAFVMLAAGVMVVVARNPVHSVLFLILAFFNAAGLFVLMGAEFLAMILVVVYVGAVAVLFLFVVMMLDVDIAELRQGFLNYLTVGGVIGVILLVELVLVFVAWSIAPDIASSIAAPTPAASEIPNTQALGDLVYTRFAYPFQAAGLILLVAMIGAIVLTARSRQDVRRQKIASQIGRRREETIEIVKVRPGEGV